MSLLNNQFCADLNILDDILGQCIEKNLTLQYPFFYNPNTPFACLLSSMFDINVKDIYISQNLLNKPLLSKIKLGTEEGLKETLIPILGNIEIQTHANKTDLEAFDFIISILPTNQSVVDLKQAREVIQIYKPLRDNLLSINISLPSAEISTHTLALSAMEFDINLSLPLNINYELSSHFVIIAAYSFEF